MSHRLPLQRAVPRARHAPLGTLLVLTALVACGETAVLAPRGGRVKLNVVAQVGLQGRQLEVRVDYRRVGGERSLLLRQTVPADTGSRHLPTVVDVAPCLRDAQRDTTGVRGGCPLLLTLTLRDAAGAAIDSATAGPLLARGGDSVVTPPMILRRTAALRIPAPSYELLVGQTSPVTARAFDAAGQELTGRRVTWSSADERVATVGADGVVRAVAPGRTTVAAAREDVRASAEVVVPAIRAIALTPATPTLYATGSQRLAATVTLESGYATRLTWRTSDPAVATVSDSGVVTAVAPGTATITAVATLDSVRRASTAVRVLPFQNVVRWVTTRPITRAPITENVYGVWGTSPDNVYAAASGILSRWDGTAWRQLPRTQGVNVCCARAVGGSGSDDVVFAGFGGSIVRWNGTQFTREASGTGAALNAVWAASRTFAVAVGDSGVATTWDGQRWRASTLAPEPLAAVWGASPTDVWAGGARGALFRYDGARWTRQTVGWTQNVVSLWGVDSATVYAGVFDPATGRAGVRRWNGGQWVDVPIPNDVQFGQPVVFGSGRSDVYVASGWRVARSDGTQWRVLPPLPIDMYWSSALSGWAAPGRAVVSGYNGIAFSWDGSRWQNTSRSPAYMGIWAADGRDVFAVGLWGTIDRYDGTRWSSMRSGTDSSLADVWGTSATDVFAVGSGGTVLHYDGAQWSRMPGVPTSAQLTGVSGTGPRDVWAVGGAVIRYDGATWRLVPTGVNAFLEGIWAASPTVAFAVGQNGTILRYDGAAWRAMASPVRDALFAVWGTSPTNVFAGGENGTLLHFDGTQWRVLQRTGRSNTYFTITGRAPDDVYAVGCGGEATPRMRFDGTAWRAMDVGGCEFSLAVLPTEGAWAGGPWELIIRGEGPRGTVGADVGRLRVPLP